MEGESQGEKGLKRAGQAKGAGLAEGYFTRRSCDSEGGGKKKSRPSGRGGAAARGAGPDHVITRGAGPGQRRKQGSRLGVVGGGSCCCCF